MLRTTSLLLSLALGSSLVAQKQLTNADIWASPAFSGERVAGLNSMNDGLHYTAQEEEGKDQVINIYDYKTGGKTGTLLSTKDLGSIAMEGYHLSNDEHLVMIETATDPLYRYSYFAYNFVYDVRSKTLKPLSDTTKSKQRLATFSPDGSHAAFVRDNNLFVVDLSTMKEREVTDEGEMNKVMFGCTDWVYEEEFALVQGYQWNNAGNKLLYLRSEETEVKQFDIAKYEHQLYPHDYTYKYPKAGEKNSDVSLHVYDLMGGIKTDVPLGKDATDFYLPRFGFTNDDNTVWFMQLNRLQNEKLIYTMKIPVPKPATVQLETKEIYRETSKTYIEVTDDLFFMKDGSGFVLTNETSGWNHIYWCPMNASGKAAPKAMAMSTIANTRPITSGNYDVLGVKGIDEAGKRVIFTASMKDPMHQEVYAIPLSGKGLKELSPPGGSNDAEFSTGFKYFINTHSNANEPQTITLHDGQGKLVKTLKDNAKLRAKLNEYDLPKKEFLKMKLDPASGPGGVVLNAWMIKPPNFDSRKQYPVFMTQYSGPNSSQVLDEWGGRNLLWHQLLAQKGYLVVCADPRGTARRGHDFRHLTYGQLGKYETEDQIAVAKWLGTQPYVDKQRIGIQGWSYGGYMSSLCITKGADVFKTAIAVAPVTNWRYYDSIYTERYMGLPQANASGYDDNSPINHVEKLRGNYLLIHGLADDNVHFQNSAEMITALVKANKPFDLMTYPDKNHGIYGGNTRLHLYEKMTNFLLEKL
ncbi:MAG: S9 family peptidase [Flavobacteriales bacterium]|nr:S9 family peptidase [Flavobacteriales bacterium]